MRVCIVYDCLFPHTVGGAERWYRNLAERLAADRHEVVYLTLRQWDRGEAAGVPNVDVVAVGPRMSLYAGPGRRRVLPPLVFGVGVFLHLLRNGRRYDVVHTASFPYFSVLAAAATRRVGHFRLLVDWHEVWTREYWRSYLGRIGGEVGWKIQLMCARVPQIAFCFSRLHAARLVNEGAAREEVTILPGEYQGPLSPEPGAEPESLVVFAGRHIPEKQVTAIPPAVAAARSTIPDLRAAVLGDGPDREKLIRQVSKLALGDVVTVPGFLTAAEVEHQLAHALCLLLPSRREGYGMVVIEAASKGTPSIVVAAPDNAAVELIEEGVNGFVAPSAAAEDLADAIVKVHRLGPSLRSSTAAWFAETAPRRSLEASLERVLDAYGHHLSAPSYA